MLKSDLVDLKDSLAFVVGYAESWLERADTLERVQLEIIVPKIKKAYEIAKLIGEE